MSIIDQYTHPFVHALGWSLLHSLWQIALIALLLKLALMFTSGNRAGIRYQISLLAVMAIPLSFIVSFLKQWDVYRHATAVVALDFEGGSLSAAAIESQLMVVQKNSSALMHLLEPFTPHICWLYLGGLSLFTMYSVFAYLQTRALRQRSRKALPPQWQHRIKDLIRQSGLRRLVPVYLSDRVHVPAVIGFLKPVILLPLSMLSSLSPAQIESMLLHELYHIKRYDHYINLFQHLTETIFFYHPLSWWIGRQLRLERESRVDEWVVKETGRPLEYANALIELEARRSISLPVAVAATASKSQLFTRIKNIMTMKTRSMHSGQVAAIVVILTAAISIAWLNPAVVVNYPPSDPNHELHSDLPYPQAFGLMPEEEATEAPPPLAEKTPQPRTVKLADGKAIEWDSLSQEDKEHIRKALEEARLAVTNANREVMMAFDSEAFRQQMEQAREEINKAMQEINREVYHTFDSEAFQMEMQQVREQVQKAMEEMNRELDASVRSHEFQQQMQKMHEDIRKAVEETNQEIYMHIQSDEFRQQIHRIKDEVNKALEEVDKSLEDIGPAVQKSLKELNLEEIFREVEKALEEQKEEEQEKE